MGLLGQAAAGFVAGAADTTADILKDKIKQDAQLVREQSLLKAREESGMRTAKYTSDLSHQNTDSGMVDSYGAKMSNSELAEYMRTMKDTDEAPKSHEEWKRLQETDKNMLLNGQEATQGEIREQQEADKARESVKTSAEERKEKSLPGFIKEKENEIVDKYIEDHPDAQGLSRDTIKKLVAAEPDRTKSIASGMIGEARYTPEDQAVIDSWKDNTGSLTRIKDIEAAAKKEKESLDRDQKAEIEKEKLAERRENNIRHNETLRFLKKDRDEEGKPLTVDKALDRGTALMKGAENATDENAKAFMLSQGQAYIEWANKKSGVSNVAPAPPKAAPPAKKGAFSELADYVLGGSKETSPPNQKPKTWAELKANKKY